MVHEPGLIPFLSRNLQTWLLAVSLARPIPRSFNSRAISCTRTVLLMNISPLSTVVVSNKNTTLLGVLVNTVRKWGSSAALTTPSHFRYLQRSSLFQAHKTHSDYGWYHHTMRYPIGKEHATWVVQEHVPLLLRRPDGYVGFA